MKSKFLLLICLVIPTLAFTQTTISCQMGDDSEIWPDRYAEGNTFAWKGLVTTSKDRNGVLLADVKNTNGFYISKEALIQILCDPNVDPNDITSGIIITYGFESVDDDNNSSTPNRRKMIPYVSSAKLNGDVPVPLKVYGAVQTNVPDLTMSNQFKIALKLMPASKDSSDHKK